MNKVYKIKYNENVEDAEIYYLMEAIDELYLKEPSEEVLLQIKKLYKALDYITSVKNQKLELKK